MTSIKYRLFHIEVVFIVQPLRGLRRLLATLVKKHPPKNKQLKNQNDAAKQFGPQEKSAKKP